MHYEITDRTSNSTIPATFADYVAKEVAKLDPIVATFPQDAIMLRIVVDEASRRRDIQIQMRLSLPSRPTRALTMAKRAFVRW